MVQVQSTWFPLYDRNPQTFVENIFTRAVVRLPEGHTEGLSFAGRGVSYRAPGRAVRRAFGYGVGTFA